MAIFVSGDGTRFELSEDQGLLGRGEREPNDPPKFNLAPLPGGQTVSRHHARLRQHASRWYLQVEPQSTNPTLLEGFPIPRGTEVPLSDGDRVQLGDIVLTFRGPSLGASPEEDTLVHAHGPPDHEVAPLASSGAPAASPGAPEPGSWVARLPERPGVLDATGVAALMRVNPFRGLMIDESTWRDGHDYHRQTAQLHTLGAHGWGIVEGLEAVACPGQGNTGSLIVRPGLAFDATGRTLLLADAVRLEVPVDVPAVLYVVLSYVEEPIAPQRAWSDSDEYTRVLDRAQVHLDSSPPAAPALELARLRLEGPVRDAIDPTLPRRGELDMRFRERLHNRPRPDLGVAQLVLEPAEAGNTTEQHRLGLRYLLREIGLTTPYRPRWAGSVQLDEGLPPVSLLYVTGRGAFEVSNIMFGALEAFLASGGVLLADACGAADSPAFTHSAEHLASQLHRTLVAVERGHPVLLSRHVLPEPPAASEGGGFILTTADFGCLWQGRARSRDEVRAAMEFGTNVAVYGRRRQHPLDVLELEA